MFRTLSILSAACVDVARHTYYVINKASRSDPCKFLTGTVLAWQQVGQYCPRTIYRRSRLHSSKDKSYDTHFKNMPANMPAKLLLRRTP